MTDYFEFKSMLEAKLQNLTSELETIAIYDAASDNWEAVVEPEMDISGSDENDNADIAEDWDERRATLENLELSYRNVKRALTKIEEGTYGICEVSGEPIEVERLRFMPEARTSLGHMDEEGNLPI